MASTNKNLQLVLETTTKKDFIVNNYQRILNNLYNLFYEFIKAKRLVKLH